MLVLSRKIGEVITIGSEVKITVLNYDRGVVRLGIDAPKSIPVHRKEIYDKIIELNQQAARTGFDAFKRAMAFSKLYFPENEAKEKELPTLFFSRNKLKK